MLANKLIEKIPHPYDHPHPNAKEHYQTFIRKKNTKSVKQAKIIIYQPKHFENQKLVDIKTVITEHLETSL